MERSDAPLAFLLVRVATAHMLLGLLSLRGSIIPLLTVAAIYLMENLLIDGKTPYGAKLEYTVWWELAAYLLRF